MNPGPSNLNAARSRAVLAMLRGETRAEHQAILEALDPGERDPSDDVPRSRSTAEHAARVVAIVPPTERASLARSLRVQRASDETSEPVTLARLAEHWTTALEFLAVASRLALRAVESDAVDRLSLLDAHERAESEVGRVLARASAARRQCEAQAWRASGDGSVVRRALALVDVLSRVAVGHRYGVRELVIEAHAARGWAVPEVLRAVAQSR